MWVFKVCIENRMFKRFGKYIRSSLGWVPSEANFGTRIQMKVIWGGSDPRNTGKGVGRVRQRSEGRSCNQESHLCKHPRNSVNDVAEFLQPWG